MSPVLGLTIPYHLNIHTDRVTTRDRRVSLTHHGTVVEHEETPKGNQYPFL